MRLLHRAGSVLLASTLALAACGGDSNDPTPFDPAAFAADLETAQDAHAAIWSGALGDSYYLAAYSLSELIDGDAPLPTVTPALRSSARGARTRALRDSVAALAAAVLRPAALAGAAVVLPNELRGTTFVWDTEAEAYVASEQAGAPDDGARMVLYTVNDGTGLPVEPLEEIGYLQVTDLSTGSADVARVVLVTDGTTRFDYRVTASGTYANGSVTVEGYVGDGTHRIEFDLSLTRSDDGTAQSWVVDGELEFDAVPLTVAYRSDDTWTEDSEAGEWTAAFRGPHGFLDLTGSYESAPEMPWLEEVVYEVNGDAFARWTCAEDAPCVYTDMDGEPLTADEEAAVDGTWGISETGYEIMGRAMLAAGFFLF